MSPADRIAMLVKGQPLLKQSMGIAIGYKEADILRNNSEPCDPPDLDMTKRSRPKFCGVDCYLVSKESCLAFMISIPQAIEIAGKDQQLESESDEA